MFTYFRGGGREEREKETEREKHQLVSSHTHPDQGLDPQPRLRALTRDQICKL